MKLKFKMLGIALLGVLATGALAVMNASATVSGHFSHDAVDGHAFVLAAQDGIHTAHSLSFQRTVSENGQKVFSGAGIVCDEVVHEGTVSASAATTVELFPSYKSCETTASEGKTPVQVTTNGCTYTFHSNANANGHAPTQKATVTVDCPLGKAIEVHHPSCTSTFGPQSLTGVTYTPVTINNKHAITLKATVSNIQGAFHGGICVFLGTNQTFDMNGSLTVMGFNTSSEQVNITAT